MAVKLCAMAFAAVLLLEVCSSLPALRGSFHKGFALHQESLEFIEHRLAKINPKLVYDRNYYMDQAAGVYGSCYYSEPNYLTTELTPENTTVGIILKFKKGIARDYEEVVDSVREIADKWLASGQDIERIRKAKKFGCSFYPNCDDKKMLLSCAFTPAGHYDWVQTNKENTDNPSLKDQPYPPGTGNQGDNDDKSSTQDFKKIEGPEFNLTPPTARALTKEQISHVDHLFDLNWDKDNYLANLSGQDVTCGILDARGEEWPFKHSTEIAQQKGMKVRGYYRIARNEGSTQDALDEIFARFDLAEKAPAGKSFGCSLVPDCVRDKKMFVVVGCLVSF